MNKNYGIPSIPHRIWDGILTTFHHPRIPGHSSSTHRIAHRRAEPGTPSRQCDFRSRTACGQSGWRWYGACWAFLSALGAPSP